MTKCDPLSRSWWLCGYMGTCVGAWRSLGSQVGICVSPLFHGVRGHSLSDAGA